MGGIMRNGNRNLSKYSRRSEEENRALVKRALTIKAYDPEINWKEIAGRLGVTRVYLRELINKYEPKQEGNSDATATEKVERVSRR
jgi:predicted transcriptional regulator